MYTTSFLFLLRSRAKEAIRIVFIIWLLKYILQKNGQQSYKKLWKFC